MRGESRRGPSPYLFPISSTGLTCAWRLCACFIRLPRFWFSKVSPERGNGGKTPECEPWLLG
ncbi:gibberellin 3-beta [Moniliophthora roreri]|nr:gibberellin 3-beta [Moniliophthora roreri]